MASKKNISSWGNYPKREGKELVVTSKKELSKIILKYNSLIPFGNRRSYGDCALHDRMIKYANFEKEIELDKNTGILKVSSNVTIGKLIKYSLKYGWFLPVVPGSKFITIGGAIASDAHGKNHYIDGCFSDHVISLEIMDLNGKILKCSKNDNSELFRATSGGMGLTGIILSAKIELIKVKSQVIEKKTYKADSIEEIFSYFQKYQNNRFCVAWIDCSKNAKSIGRGIFSTGNYFDKKTKLKKSAKNIRTPFYLPPYFINKYTIKIFNYIYYNFHSLNKNKSTLVHFNEFFFPLDRVLNWNKLYGRLGFIQYQLVIPENKSLDGIKEILEIFLDASLYSPITVLKRFGPENKNYLSFPMRGYTLSIDLKCCREVFIILDKVDILVKKMGGRIYLAKDARIQNYLFEKSYSDIEKFRKYRDENNLKDKFQSDQSNRISI